MNRDHILSHLREGKAELDQTITEIESDPDYDVGELLVAMGHLYNHINTAWNGRDRTSGAATSGVEREFYRLRQFPDDIDMS